MFVTINCRVLLHSMALYRVLLYRVLLSSHSLWIKNKLHHQNISKSNVLSLLSTAMGLVHEPLLPRGVVNLQQTKSGTQCGAYGWWIGPFTYQCDAELLHDIASHPSIKQYQQLAYVGWQAADTKSHTKNGFLLWENSSKHMTFPKQPTGQHLSVHNPITHFTSVRNHVLEDCAQIPSWDAVICDTETHSIPWRNVETWRTSQSRRGRSQSHPKMVWPSIQRGDPRIHSCGQEERKKTVQWMFYSAGGTELSKKC